MDWLSNVLLLTDSYKVSHYRQYPPGTRRVYSYFEARAGATFPETTVFGLQYFLKRYLAGAVVTPERIDEAEAIFATHFASPLFNRAGWEHIARAHGGRLPVEVRAVPEGTNVPAGNVLMTVENTDDAAYWLTNYLETLLVQAWYPCTVATQSRAMKGVLAAALDRTGDPAALPFQLHDFGVRGTTCPEQAALGGAAHLVHFRGTDNVPALALLRAFYHEPAGGFSIPAAEHSTITAWGRAGEADAYRNMLTAYPTGLVAVVSDSYDVFRACEHVWGEELRDAVLARDGVLVIRPDSGDPTAVVPKVLGILGAKFGFTTNAKGFKVLNPKVRVIQGDGIEFRTLGGILDAVAAAGWAADNLAFGSGGGLLQKLNRDTQRFAFKCSAATVGTEEREVFKQPATDAGKRSKAGRLKLVETPAGLATVPHTDPRPDVLRPVFRDGEVLVDEPFAAVRARAASPAVRS